MTRAALIIAILLCPAALPAQYLLPGPCPDGTCAPGVFSRSIPIQAAPSRSSPIPAAAPSHQGPLETTVRPGPIQAAPIHAAPPKQFTGQTPAAVVRVANDQSRAAGTGTVIYLDPNGGGLVLTCAHVFREAQVDPTIIAAGHQHRGKLLGLDPTNDLAAIYVERFHAPVQVVPVATQPANPGEPVRSAGLGGFGGYQVNAGQATQYVSYTGGQQSGALELSGFARSGDSGGPVLNEAGELVAVVAATTDHVVTGSGVEPIRRFLGQVFPDFDTSHETRRRKGQAPPAASRPAGKLPETETFSPADPAATATDSPEPAVAASSLTQTPAICPPGTLRVGPAARPQPGVPREWADSVRGWAAATAGNSQRIEAVAQGLDHLAAATCKCPPHESIDQQQLAAQITAAVTQSIEQRLEQRDPGTGDRGPEDGNTSTPQPEPRIPDPDPPAPHPAPRNPDPPAPHPAYFDIVPRGQRPPSATP